MTDHYRDHFNDCRFCATQWPCETEVLREENKVLRAEVRELQRYIEEMDK